MGEEKTLALGLLTFAGADFLLIFAAGQMLSSISPLITGFLLLLGLLAGPSAFIIYKYGSWLIPYFTKGQRIVASEEANVEIPLTDDVIVRREGDSYFATQYLAVKLFKSSTAMTEEEKFGFMELWEKAVSGLKAVTKYSVLVYIKDLTKYRESIEIRKGNAQLALGEARDKPTPDQWKLDKLEREIAMWDNILSKLGIGEKPTALLTFIQTTAAGPTKDGAIAAARAQANEIRTTVGTALNVEVVPITGEEMRRCFDWSYAIPSSVKEI